MNSLRSNIKDMQVAEQVAYEYKDVHDAISRRRNNMRGKRFGRQLLWLSELLSEGYVHEGPSLLQRQSESAKRFREMNLWQDATNRVFDNPQTTTFLQEAADRLQEAKLETAAISVLDGLESKNLNTQNSLAALLFQAAIVANSNPADTPSLSKCSIASENRTTYDYNGILDAFHPEAYRPQGAVELGITQAYSAFGMEGSYPSVPKMGRMLRLKKQITFVKEVPGLVGVGIEFTITNPHTRIYAEDEVFIPASVSARALAISDKNEHSH